MYAKVFTQIYDSSIADDYLVRLVFEDFLALADVNGVVDMTHEAISRRTNVPIEIVKRAIDILEQPDKKSRRSEHEGRRIIKLDEHRDWGWFIVNYLHYREIASEQQRRACSNARAVKHREKKKAANSNANVTHSNANVTHSNDSPYTSTSTFTSSSSEGECRGETKVNPNLKSLAEIQPSESDAVAEGDKVGVPPAISKACHAYYQRTGWRTATKDGSPGKLLYNLASVLKKWHTEEQSRSGETKVKAELTEKQKLIKHLKCNFGSTIQDLVAAFKSFPYPEYQRQVNEQCVDIDQHFAEWGGIVRFVCEQYNIECLLDKPGEK